MDRSQPVRTVAVTNLCRRPLGIRSCRGFSGGRREGGHAGKWKESFFNIAVISGEENNEGKRERAGASRKGETVFNDPHPRAHF